MSDLGIPYFNPNLYGTPGNLGYPDLGESDLFEEEESEGYWEYETALDERVCPRCAPLDGEQYSDEEVGEFFPNASELDDSTLEVNEHDGCRCLLYWIEEYYEEEEA